ncbi:uncharacterized protein [Rutidosis leptorrhynchoides]|uniref:uncharacterized protein n=1 Tax=Rutidosis leptorrhynchoides TaxID=125765 RepID=UPI003A98E5FA
MRRSSKSKSHKQSSKHTSSSTAREYSGSDDDVKLKERSSNGGKEDVVSVRGCSEKRKRNKDLLISHVNGDVIVSDKDHGGSDRWNGGSSDLVVNVDDKGVLKLKGLSEWKSKSGSSRRHDSDSVVVVDDIKSGSANHRSEKRKSERKDSSLYKENKESNDKDHSSDRGRKGLSDKVEVDGLLKQGENHSSKRGKEITDWPIEEELRNPELEKEFEKRVRRREEGSSDKGKYNDDVKEVDDRRLSSRSFRSKDERHENEEYVDIIGEDDIKETRQRGEKHRKDSERDRKNRDVKHRGESERYNKHRVDKYHEDGNKDNKYKDEKYDKDERIRDGKRKQDDDRDYYKHKEDKHRDDYDREKRTRDSKYTSRDLTIEPETKRARDDRKANNRNGSPFYDDRVTRYKDDKERRRVNNDKEESSEYRSRSMKDQHPESEKRSSNKVDSVSELVRSGSRYADVEVNASQSRRRSSPSGSTYSSRDHRVSKQEETKYRDYAYEDRVRHTAHSSRDYTSSTGQSDKKVNPKDDSYIRPESRSSPQVDKSPSSTSNERKNLSRSNTRRSEEPGPAKDTVKDNKGSRDLSIDNDFSQADNNNNDNISVSSAFTRNSNSQFSGNSKSEDDRNKSTNRHRRMVDPNMGRAAQGNWKNVPNWPSPMTGGGYMPFQHDPPPMFHPLMQQFPQPIFGRPPMKLTPGLPYHGEPPPMHGWDANNSAAFGDWDRRTHMNIQGWDQSGEMWKGQNVVPRSDVQVGPPQDWYPARGPTETGQADENEQNQMDIQTETLNLETNTFEAEKITKSPKIFEDVQEDNYALISKAYFSRVDVSQDLTLPELYDQCTSLMDLGQEQLSDEFGCKILFLEQVGVEANVTDIVSLFTAINDSVFQKAMLLYKKQKDEIYLVGPEFVPPVDQHKGGSDKDDKPTEEKLDTEANMIAESAKTEEQMDIDLDCAVVKQEEEPDVTLAAVEENVEPSAGGLLLPCKVEDVEYESTNGVSTADVAVMPTESVEFGSVNLNRIHHHSHESTH